MTQSEIKHTKSMVLLRYQQKVDVLNSDEWRRAVSRYLRWPFLKRIITAKNYNTAQKKILAVLEESQKTNETVLSNLDLDAQMSASINHGKLIQEKSCQDAITDLLGTFRKESLVSGQDPAFVAATALFSLRIMNLANKLAIESGSVMLGIALNEAMGSLSKCAGIAFDDLKSGREPFSNPENILLLKR